jgi:very-short-patch-repair endonuclease
MCVRAVGGPLNESTIEAAVPAVPSQYSLRISHADKLNLADFQNSVPLLRELFIVNNGEREIVHLKLSLESIPPFLKSKTWTIDACSPLSTYAIKDCDVLLDGTLLSKLTEAETATIIFTLTENTGSAGEHLLAVNECKVELLPKNQWSGLSHMPDLIAAFVQPNELTSDRLLKQTAEVLRNAGKSAAIDGYGDGAKRVWELASALWSAVGDLGIDYALPPASFEHRGQKVRSAAQVLDARIATCLDLTLLFCAVLEQAGLNPIIVFTRGHAFPGVWLRAEQFPTVVTDDVTAIRKRLRLKELVVFESTLITHRPTPSFTYATEVAAAALSVEKEEEFELIVDIRRARMLRIKPLSSNDQQLFTDPPIPPVSSTQRVFEEAPDLPEMDLATAETASAAPIDRLARWQRKLLDLSLRNNLLNFKNSRKTLKLDAPEPGALEDLLSDGTPIRLLPRPQLMDGTDPRNQAIHEQRTREDVRREHALDALERREVFVALEQQELESRLVELYRAARATLQEGGANTLFLALGFLTWARDDKAEQQYRAPLILVPVSLQRKSVRSGFTISLHEDEPRFNPTLVEMLRQDFTLNLGVIDGDLPRDEAGLDIGLIWKMVSHAVRDISGWEVSEEVVLSTFSFAKYLMWVDLTQRIEQLRENPVVRHLIDSPRDPYPSSVDFPDARRLDMDFTPDKTFCPLPADSSQLTAVMAAFKGKDFVLVGPPGTGKSQTISNLIAHCLAEGKRVLFVSEKIAALYVVYRRLREVGLGEFCLELHSNKARKLDVLAQLQKAWESQAEFAPEEWQTQADKLRRYREELNRYVDRLHHKHRNGLTIFRAIGVVVEGEEVPALNLLWQSPEAHDGQELDAMRDVVERLGVNATAVGQAQLLSGPLSAVSHDDWTPVWQQAFLGTTRRLIPVADAVLKAKIAFEKVTALPDLPTTRRARDALLSLTQCLPAAAGHHWEFVFRPDVRELFTRLRNGLDIVLQHRALNDQLSPLWSDSVLAQCKKALAVLAEYDRIRSQLSQVWPDDVTAELNKGLQLLGEIEEIEKRLSTTYGAPIEQLNVHQLHRNWMDAEQSLWPVSWLLKRQITSALEAAAIGEDAPQAAIDLPALVKLRDLRSNIAQIDPGLVTGGVWMGLKTRPDLLATVLQFQAAVASVHQRKPWRDDGFDAIANGRCGSRLETELSNIRTLRNLEAEIAGMAALSEQTDGLWAGHDTQTGRLSAAMRFIVSRKFITASGALPGHHEEVAASECGAMLMADYQLLLQRAAIEQRLSAFDGLGELTGTIWAGLNTKQDDIAQAAAFSTAISSAIGNLVDNPEMSGVVRLALERLVADGNVMLAHEAPVANAGRQYQQAYADLRPALVDMQMSGSFSDASTSDLHDLALPSLIKHCHDIASAENRLHAWCAWRKVRSEALKHGLANLVTAMENATIKPHEVRRAFDTNYSRWWLNAVIDNEPVIRTFVSAEHEKRIGDFRELDKRFTDLTRSWIRASLSAGLPKTETVTRNSEWGILRHEMSKKKQHLPLRALMESIPTALVKLTPCLLMSPLSIAQYLPAQANAFDLVVFDEASQIPVWDAIGAIARGKQVVMVGDPKQLPPTVFFDRADSTQDDDDAETDLESILDECIGANLPRMNLTWHYRSRSESLIAFSNHHYYGGALVTFPSPSTQDTAVSFHYVNGVYEKGGARTNKPEAKALVADIVARLKSSIFRESKFTLGVVTFNTEQMTLIEDLLDEERRKDPSIESYFSESALEPVFVKNLEAVQGDERDIIYFSITYGPDHSGAISMNFGPMNRNGGERRLNVAITRARVALRVFSSLKGDQLDLSRTQAAGVRDMKHFLEFAERGPRALAEATKGSMGGFDSPFEEAVAVALASKGWSIQTQIGASSFRVDLGIVHPDAPGAYLCGIECDGATYHRSATARDRDMLREQVLRGLGWEILRIWSTDWWIDRTGTLDKVDQALHRILENSRMTRAKQNEREATERAVLETMRWACAHAARAETSKVEMPSQATPTPFVRDQIDTVFDENKTIHTTTAYAGNAPPSNSNTTLIFVEADPRVAVEIIDAEAFFEPSYDARLRQMIEYVTDIEGPILDTVLARRIARAHGWQRTGARIQERVSTLALSCLTASDEDVGVFFWANARGPDVPLVFRSSEQESRKVDEICMAELVSLAKDVEQKGSSVDTAIAAIARALGLQRVKAMSRARLEKALDLARQACD